MTLKVITLSKYKDYGKLANIQVEDLLVGERVENDEYDKEEMRDFGLQTKENQFG